MGQKMRLPRYDALKILSAELSLDAALDDSTHGTDLITMMTDACHTVGAWRDIAVYQRFPTPYSKRLTMS